MINPMCDLPISEQVDFEPVHVEPPEPTSAEIASRLMDELGFVFSSLDLPGDAYAWRTKRYKHKSAKISEAVFYDAGYVRIEIQFKGGYSVLQWIGLGVFNRDAFVAVVNYAIERNQEPRDGH